MPGVELTTVATVGAADGMEVGPVLGGSSAWTGAGNSGSPLLEKFRQPSRMG